MKGSIRSALAVVAGFLATAIASMAADATMHAARIFPSSPGEMSNCLFAIASTYRALLTVAGGFTTARLAPDQAMHEVWILAAIGLLAGLAGVIVYYAIGGMTLGPCLVCDLDSCRSYSLRLAGGTNSAIPPLSTTFNSAVCHRVFSGRNREYSWHPRRGLADEILGND
jgi:hypothetical protein